MDQYRLHPKVVVINADPFFTDGLSPPAQSAIDGGVPTLVDAAMKKAFEILLPILCRVPALCSQAYGSVYREKQTGQWVWQEVLISRETKGALITARKVTPWSETYLPAWQARAEAFLAQLSLSRSCVILTAVPTPQIFGEDIATRLGPMLGLPVVLPRAGPLTSPDDSHLSADSAERWSAAFLADSAPLIDACLAKPMLGK